MNTTHDPFPAHLDRIGRQLTATAEELRSLTPQI
jgi:hypothetical protein